MSIFANGMMVGMSYRSGIMHHAVVLSLITLKR